LAVGTALHSRTSKLNRKLQWREWSGYFAASVYAHHHDIEYNAIREAAALIDVSPLYKYLVSGPDATRLIDRIITRDATKIRPGGVIYTCWCNESGKVLDDGTVARLDTDQYRWTAADPSLRWLRQNSAGLNVSIEDITDSVAAIALQGPLARSLLANASSQSWDDLPYFSRRATRIAGIRVDVSRTGYTGDLGYELWMPARRATRVWDTLMEAGRPLGVRPAGMLALDMVRLEAGLILIEVDFTSARHAVIPEQAYFPGEIGLGRLVNLRKDKFVGKRALVVERERWGTAPPSRGARYRLDGNRAPQCRAGAASRRPRARMAGGRPRFPQGTPGGPGH
jgi:aminomethyltransferase